MANKVLEFETVEDFKKFLDEAPEDMLFEVVLPPVKKENNEKKK